MLVQIVVASLLIVLVADEHGWSAEKIGMRISAEHVGKYQKVALTIDAPSADYENPFDPQQVDLNVQITTPAGKELTLPAFYCQQYERRRISQGRGRDNWYYPTGRGTLLARFAPMEVGAYSAYAVLTDKNGTGQSDKVRFECIDSTNKGFVRVNEKDPRFFEFSEGEPFFVVGQNLAFIGEGQYVNLTKAEEIFQKLSQNGANFVRVWTCCEDWAMAIEARKSAWGRSWGQKAPIVPMPGSENEPQARKYVKIEGGDGKSITVSPSHEVALRPQTRYVLRGRYRTDGANGLKVEVHEDTKQFDAPLAGQWKQFEMEFATGQNDYWLGRLVLSLVGSGTAWVDGLSLQEAGGGAELLWEADVNRAIRGFYNQLDCFMLDELIESAERNGIYLMLCVITRDLYMNRLSDEKSPEYAQAAEDAKKLMRYAVARWGYSTSVAAWEYFNEIDPGKPTDRFYDEVGRYLEQVDTYHHLRTTSTWHPSAKDCRHPRLDIGQLHHYMRPETKEDFKNEVSVIIEKTQFLRQHAPNKPVLIGEFGLATDKWGLSDYMKQDTNGVHFHNSLWASAFSGVSGTAMFWWWDQLDRQNVYGHYRPLAKFLADVSFAGLQRTTATASNERVRVLGYQGSDRVYLWLFNNDATWWNVVVDNKAPPLIKNTTMEVRNLQPGGYRISWWDTHTGSTISQEKVTTKADVLSVSVPRFNNDIACQIVR
jgi:hypothetical protein